MSRTIKKLLDNVLNRCGLSEQDQYYGGDDFTLKGVLDQAVEDIKLLNLQKLRKEGTITLTTATQYTLPTDLNYIVPNTVNVEDQERYVNFPVSTPEWYYLKSRTTSSGFRYKARMADGSLEFDTVNSGDVVIYEYMTKNVVYSDGDATPSKERFSNDSDTFLLDEELLIRCVKYLYKMEKGLEGWQNDKALYDQYKKKLIGREKGSKSLQMGINSEPLPFPYFDTWVS
jgi:hypothetical protein